MRLTTGEAHTIFQGGGFTGACGAGTTYTTAASVTLCAVCSAACVFCCVTEESPVKNIFLNEIVRLTLHVSLLWTLLVFTHAGFDPIITPTTL